MTAVSSLSNGKGLAGGDQNQWDFSISSQMGHQRQPVDENHSDVPNTTSLTNSDRMESLPGNSISNLTKPKGKADPNYLSPYKPGLKSDHNGSRSGSEPDSLLDLYKQRNSTRDKGVESPMPSPRHAQETVDAHSEEKDTESRWIHKDKLAEIERREMEAAGIVPPPARSKSKSRRAQSPEKNTNVPTAQLDEAPPVKEKKRRKIQSPTDQEPQPPTQLQPDYQLATSPTLESLHKPEQEHELPDNEFDLRTPEEIAADSYLERTTSPVYRGQHSLRSSSSRIPLPRSSPMPLPQEHLERNAPLPRKRGGSGEWDGEDSILYQRSRSRGNSIGSQVLLDDTPTHTQEGSSSNSPSKPRTPSTNTKHTRKISTSTPNSNQKPRSASATQTTPRSPSSIRPKSRSGLETRPPTAINRPEGDAPWLKDMYKPDPMLPPDQQLIPTHAKRLQEEARRQEQWEEAKRDSEARKKARKDDMTTGNGVDTREFSPLAEYTAKGLQPSQNNENSTAGGNAQGEDGPEWPLTRATPSRPPFDQTNSGGGPGIGPDKIGNAGYSAMPRLRSGANGEAPLLQPADNYRATVTSPNSKSVEGKDPFEKEKLSRTERDEGSENGRRRNKDKNGGCCACVIM